VFHPAFYPMGIRALSPGLKWPGREAEQSPPSSTEVQNSWSLPPLPQYVFMAWCLVKYRDCFIFTYLYLTSFWEPGWLSHYTETRLRAMMGFFLFTTGSRLALWLTQHPLQWVSGLLFWGVKQLGHEADHSPPI